MDEEHDGHVTKLNFIKFMRVHPQLRELMLRWGKCDDKNSNKKQPSDAGKAENPLAQETRTLVRIMRLWKVIDQDKSGTLEWEEFDDY